MKKFLAMVQYFAQYQDEDTDTNEYELEETAHHEESLVFNSKEEFEKTFEENNLEINQDEVYDHLMHGSFWFNGYYAEFIASTIELGA